MNAAGKFAREFGVFVRDLSGYALGGIVVGNVALIGLHASDVLQSHVSRQVEKLKPSKSG
jgi:hypothetical protein